MLKKDLQIKKQKATYITPKIEIIYIDMEFCIAATSAFVSPVKPLEKANTVWEVESDRDEDIIW